MAEMTNRTCVVGVFENYDDADRAVQELLRAGFSRHDVGFAMRHQEGQLDDAEKAASYGEAAIARTTTGAITGGVLGAVLGALTTLALPGLGLVVLSGALALGAGGAIAGGFAGLISTFQLDEEEMRYYEGELASGRPIVAVRAGSRFSEAVAILGNSGARDVNRQKTECPSTPSRV
jgi:hypothetical protein